MSTVVDQLERLERLRESGALHDAEFTAEKARLLAPEAISFGPDWRSIRRYAAFILVVGIVVIAVLLIIPAPKRAIDDPNNAVGLSSPAAVGTPTAAPQIADSAASVAPVPAQQTSSVSSVVDQSYVEPKPVKGRCLLRINGANYIDGTCDITMEQDGSFDVNEHYDQPGYFAKVLRDGSSARGYWNGARNSDHAHDDLGDLKRNGACWENANARICAWS